jgi:hypothetical protein
MWTTAQSEKLNIFFKALYARLLTTGVDSKALDLRKIVVVLM